MTVSSQLEPPNPIFCLYRMLDSEKIAVRFAWTGNKPSKLSESRTRPTWIACCKQQCCWLISGDAWWALKPTKVETASTVDRAASIAAWWSSPYVSRGTQKLLWMLVPSKLSHLFDSCSTIRWISEQIVNWRWTKVAGVLSWIESRLSSEMSLFGWWRFNLLRLPSLLAGVKWIKSSEVAITRAFGFNLRLANKIKTPTITIEQPMNSK